MTLWSNQSNLNRGEIDETLDGRIDTDLYYNGLKRARNVLLTPQGGAKKRPGTRYIEKFTSISACKLEQFSFNNETEYLLLFMPSGAGYRIIIYKDGVKQTNINGSGNDYLEDANTLNIPQTGFYYIQSANTAIVFSSAQPMVITRTSDTAWAADPLPFANIPQYDFNDALSPTPTSEVHSLVLVSVNASDRYKITIDGFISDEVTYATSGPENATRIQNAIQDMPNTDNEGVSVVHVSGATYTVTFGGASGNFGLISCVAVLTQSTSFAGESSITTPGVTRKEDVFSSTRGYPKCGVFHQSRLWVGGTSALPDSLWASVIGDFYNFDSGKARDDESIFVTLQTNQVNEIQSITSSRKLQVYTSGAEFYCPQDVITPSNVTFEQITNYGSAYIKPATLDGQVIFPQDVSRALVLMSVVNQYQPPASRNVGVLAPHLLAGISRIVVARGNESSDANYIYLLNSDGNVACLNYLPSEAVEGFSLWDMDDSIIDIAVVGKKLYFAVLRGSDMFIEVEDSSYPVDSGVPITSSSTVDLTHLVGVSVDSIEVVGDGAYLGTVTASASTALTRTVTSGYAGISFRPQVKTMSIVNPLANGTNYGRKKRIRRALLSVYQSNSITVNGTTVPDRTIGVNQFEAPSPQTNLIRVPLRGYALEQFLDIGQTAPLGFHIRSLGVEMKV